MRLLLPLLLATGLSLPASAEDYSAAFTSCMDASGGVTINMLDCIASETTAQDVRLNQAYRAAMQALDASQQPGLREVQRLWIQYRDANCGMFASLTGGTIDRISAADCVLRMTTERAAELEGIGGL